MVIAALVFLIIGIALGVIMLTFALEDKHIPKGLAFMHGGAVITGFIILLIYALTTGHHHKHWDSIIIFAMAALIGIYIFERDLRHKKFPKWTLLIHAALGLGGVIWLLTHVLGGK